MNGTFWLVMAGFGGTIGGAVWYLRRKAERHRLAEEARVAAFMSGLAGVPKPAPGNISGAEPPIAPAPAPAPVQTNSLALQKLLFDAAHKAGEAGEPALAIQLYARLLSRYPDTSFAEPARAAVAALHKKVVKS